MTVLGNVDLTNLPLEKKLSFIRGTLFNYREYKVTWIDEGLIVSHIDDQSTTIVTVTVKERHGRQYIHAIYENLGDISKPVRREFVQGYFGLVPQEPTEMAIVEDTIRIIQHGADLIQYWLQVPQEQRQIIENEPRFIQRIFIDTDTSPEWKSGWLSDQDRNLAYIVKQAPFMEPLTSVSQKVKLVISLVICVAGWAFLGQWLPLISVVRFPASLLIIAGVVVLGWCSVATVTALLTGWRVAYRTAAAPWKLLDKLPAPDYRRGY